MRRVLGLGAQWLPTVAGQRRTRTGFPHMRALSAVRAPHQENSLAGVYPDGGTLSIAPGGAFGRRHPANE